MHHILSSQGSKYWKAFYATVGQARVESARFTASDISISLTIKEAARKSPSDCKRSLMRSRIARICPSGSVTTPLTPERVMCSRNDHAGSARPSIGSLHLEVARSTTASSLTGIAFKMRRQPCGSSDSHFHPTPSTQNAPAFPRGRQKLPELDLNQQPSG